MCVILYCILFLVGNETTTGERRRKKVVKNLGEMFGDFNQSFHREVTTDHENEQ